jgi:hypothetical protein
MLDHGGSGILRVLAHCDAYKSDIAKEITQYERRSRRP